ncbi:MAG: EAL domain-containing protein [Coriobacteriales bacterium]
MQDNTDGRLVPEPLENNPEKLESFATSADSNLVATNSASACSSASEGESLETDPLTGLLTRNSFLEVMSSRIAEHTGNGPQSVVYFNLPKFKMFNVHYGLDEGNSLLKRIACTLKQEFQDGAVARFSGDNFAVYTQSAHVTTQVVKVHDDLLDAGEHSWELKAGIRNIEPSDESSPIELCDEAKMACDEIKNRSGISFLVYYDDLGYAMERDAYIADGFDRALSNGYITVYFQPMVRTITKKVCAFEALSRWNDPGYGQISPAAFVPVLESNGSIKKLDMFVLGEICRSIHDRMAQGKPVVPVSFNLSRVDFLSDDLVPNVSELVERYEIPRGLVRIEITESMLAGDHDLVLDKVDQLRKVGFEIWMDDFGTGYSSLSFLKDCYFDGVKIDALFIRDLNKRAETILTTVIEMAKALGSRTLAEGAETRSQVEFLRQAGCEIIQGYYFAEPQPIDECLSHCEEIGLEFETPIDAGVMQKVGSINTSTDAPFALLWDDGKTISIAFSNKAFDEVMRSVGLDSVRICDKLFEDDGRDASEISPNDLVDRAVKTGKPETAVLSENGYRLKITVQSIAVTDEYRVLGLTPVDITDSEMGIKHDQYSSMSSVIMHAFRDVMLIDSDADTVTVLDPDTGAPIMQVDHVIDYMREYASTTIHPDDRLRFIANVKQILRIMEDPKRRQGQVTVTFRQRNESGYYVMSEMVAAASERGGSKGLLLCTKEASSTLQLIDDAHGGVSSPNAGSKQDRLPADGREAEFASDGAFADVLNGALADALSEPDPDVSIQRLLENLGKLLHATRTYVLEENGSGTFSNTYEWCTPTATPRKAHLQEVESNVLQVIIDEFASQNSFIIPDIEDAKQNSPQVYSFFSSRGTRSVAMAVLEVGGKRIGFFGIENPAPEELGEVEKHISLVSQFISIMVRNRNVMAHLDYLSLRDDLTGILNRRGLVQYIRTVPDKLQLILVYGDINNLKAVNDSLGHEAGDKLIKECGQLMLQVAGRGHVYRLGGDEFAMTFELDPDDDGSQPMKEVRRVFEEHGISIALGYSSTITPVSNIDGLLQNADRRMYENKQAMHASGKSRSE